MDEITQNYDLVSIAIGFGIMIVVFLVIRGLILWYFGVSKLIRQNEIIINELRKLNE